MTSRYVGTVLGLKGIIAIASLMIIVAALVSYTATVTITVVSQLTQGKASQAWDISPNDVNEVRYLPAATTVGDSLPTFSAGDSDTWAFKVVTDANKVCAVKIELTAAVNNTKYSKFEITVMWYNTTALAWQDATLYTAASGGTTKSYINGRTGWPSGSVDSGYIRQGLSDTKYYLIRVTYSYGDAENADSVTFRYTPYALDSFT